mmetsp:Transcript_27010/g.42877  ORF Transcript_27010/g.42877 Transcript_27010/m.42877 type:complete len:563 (-) Transcript_27010:222-1910(-)|eukprot:1393277-Amorphochlora_amoeboformis.AAC.1
MIGKKFDDPTIASDKLGWPFKVIRGTKDSILIEVEYRGKVQTFSPEQISGMVLNRMKDIAKRNIDKDFVEVVVTVPAYFNDSQRVATKDAGAIAGLKVSRIVNEPTAACIAYGMHRKKKGDRERSVLIFDFGGGTFDVSILLIDEGIFEVKATNGDTHLGGEDLDRKLTEYYIKDFAKKFPTFSIADNDRAKRRLKAALERAKRTVSTKFSTQIELDSLCEDIDYHFTLTRARLETECDPLFKKLIDPVHTCIADAGFRKKKINDIVLVGGSTRIPAVQRQLEEMFHDRTIAKSINPDEAVAYGAAVQGAILSGLEDETINSMLLIDVIPLSLGVETEGNMNEIIVPKNSTVPTIRHQMFSASSNYQTGIVVRVFEGERPNVKDCHFLGEFSIKLNPVKMRDSQIKINFDLDADGVLAVTAIDLNSSYQDTLTITSDKRTLTKDDVDFMIEEAKKYQSEDISFKKISEKKVELRNQLHLINNYFDDEANYKNYFAKNSIEEFKSYVYKVSMWVDHDPITDASDIDKKILEIREKFNKLLTSKYSSPKMEEDQDKYEMKDDLS